jgi:hypothetical protein
MPTMASSVFLCLSVFDFVVLVLIWSCPQSPNPPVWASQVAGITSICYHTGP